MFFKTWNYVILYASSELGGVNAHMWNFDCFSFPHQVSWKVPRMLLQRNRRSLLHFKHPRLRPRLWSNRPQNLQQIKWFPLRPRRSSLRRGTVTRVLFPRLFPRDHHRIARREISLNLQHPRRIHRRKTSPRQVQKPDRKVHVPTTQTVQAQVPPLHEFVVHRWLEWTWNLWSRFDLKIPPRMYKSHLPSISMKHLKRHSSRRISVIFLPQTTKWFGWQRTLPHTQGRNLHDLASWVVKDPTGFSPTFQTEPKQKWYCKGSLKMPCRVATWTPAIMPIIQGTPPTQRWPWWWGQMVFTINAKINLWKTEPTTVTASVQLTIMGIRLEALMENRMGAFLKWVTAVVVHQATKQFRSEEDTKISVVLSRFYFWKRRWSRSWSIFLQ